jgi:beta-xylosidase
MKRNLAIFALAFLIVVTTSVFLAITVQINANAESVTTKFTWIDNFDSGTLDSRWSWVNEDPAHWSLTTNPGYLHIVTQNGGIFVNAHHNLLLTDVPAEDYQITTLATISPTEDFQGAAIIVYSDDENYVRVSRRFAGGNEVNFRYESNDTLVENTGVSETAATVYLRINKEGNLYKGYYSTDGINYIFISQTVAMLSNPRIGIISESGTSTTEIPSDYDFFEVEYNLQQIFLPFVKR